MEDKRKMPPIKRSKGNAWLAVIALAGAVIFSAQTAAAAIGDASDLSNVPMEVRQKSAPASIMYILDDSGSMHDNRVDPVGNLLQQNTAKPVPAWLFARHDTNTLYYDPSQQYTPWPGLSAIGLNKIAEAPNWPDASSLGGTVDTVLRRRNITYTAYNGADGSGEATRDLTATATWYTVEHPGLESAVTYTDYTDPSNPVIKSYNYNVPYGYFPAAAQDPSIGINLPATHYFVCKDKTKSCANANQILPNNELWLVVLRYNGSPSASTREFYQVIGLTQVLHNRPSYINSLGQSTNPAPDSSYELQIGNFANGGKPYAEADVPDAVKPHWTKPDGSVYTPSAGEELGNFLQWYVYYSTRNFTTINAIATSLQQLSGVNVGMYSINTATYSGSGPKLRIGVMPVKVGDIDQTNYLLSRLYNFYAVDGVTPFTQAYETVARYFDMSRTDTFVVGDDQGAKKPYADAADGGSCQQAFIINFTDGVFDYWPWSYTSYPGAYIPNDLDGDGRYYTGGSCTYPCVKWTQYQSCPQHCDTYGAATVDGGSAPCLSGYYYLPDKSDCTSSSYCSQTDNTLPPLSCTNSTFWPTISDIAKYYYDQKDLSPAPDHVPTTAHDSNNKQHLVTYSVALGLSSTFTTSYYDSSTARYYSYADYRNDPYFDNHPQPNWGSSGNALDYLWHASVVSKGIFYNVNDAAGLTDAFKSIASNIGAASAAVGAAAASSGGQLTDNATLYVGRYNSDDWTGQLFAYSISKANGSVDTAHPIWEAAKNLQNRTTADRLIFTSDGNKTHGIGMADTGQALVFTSTSTELKDGLTSGQLQMLGDTTSDHTAFNNNIDYIRGKNDGSGGLRVRGSSDKNVLGDIIHSSPVLVRAAAISAAPVGDPKAGTIYVGANDGMLHAFNVETGEERFAFIPSQVHDHLLALGTSDYVSKHRYYVDATPVIGRMTFFNSFNAGQAATKSKDMQLLVSGLGRGGRGYFALDVAKAESVTSISDVKSMLQWEYPTRQMIATPPVNVTDPMLDQTLKQTLIASTAACTYQASGQNNPDGDGELFCPDNSDAHTQVLAYRDDDLGYSYSAPVIFPSNNRSSLQYPTSALEHPWVVVFGNGYGSKNGKAILYVLDALSGKLIKKIDTGSGPNVAGTPQNGLSSPAALDANGDGKVDFVYAGDLYGNLWKFDFRSTDPAKWGVAYKDGASQPQPLFTTMQKGQSGQPDQLGQPITSAPDIVPHNKKIGYIIVFGTGQFLEPGDFADTNVQSLFGIWDGDIGDIAATPTLNPPGLGKYLGTWKRSENVNPESGYPFSNTSAFPHASLLKQQVIYQGQLGDSGSPTVRIISDNPITWYNTGSGASGNVGWYLDLPGVASISLSAQPTVASSPVASERIIDDVAIRFGNVLAVSFTPGEEVCSAGGKSVLMQVSAFTGGTPQKARLDLGSLTSEDKVYFASGLIINGKATMPTITPGANSTTEWYTPFSSDGNAIPTAAERPPHIFFWREVGN